MNRLASERPDLLLAHGYCLVEDELERRIMKPYPPLGLLYLSSHLKRAGMSVEVFDSTFRSRSEFEQVLEARRPRVVGLSANLMTKFNVLRMIEQCRRAGIPTILGGPEPAQYAQEYLDFGVDVVVVGEGELTLEEIVPRLSAGGAASVAGTPGVIVADGLGGLVNGGPRKLIGDLSGQPWPDREAIDCDRYLEVWKRHHGKGSLSLITARGCPYTCAWCSHSVYGRSYRRRAASDVADEIQWLLGRYAPDQLWFADDVFTLDRRFILELAGELERRAIRIPFECISRADRIDPEVVEALVGLGCWRLWIGSESGSQRILDRMQRRTAVEDVRAKARLLQAAGIEVGMFIMLGYDGEEASDIAATIEHLKACAPDVYLTTVAYPIKGTSYYDEVAGAIRTDRPWAQRTDRDLRIEGRHSARYYHNAVRWIEGSVALHRASQSGRLPSIERLQSWLKTMHGRIGMRLARAETEVGKASGRGWRPADRTGVGW